MARSMEIPAVVGTKVVMEKIQNGDIVIIDGLDGEVIVNPSEETLRSFEEKKRNLKSKS